MNDNKVQIGNDPLETAQTLENIKSIEGSISSPQDECAIGIMSRLNVYEIKR